MNRRHIEKDVRIGDSVEKKVYCELNYQTNMKKQIQKVIRQKY
jgi:hypothetical protein